MLLKSTILLLIAAACPTIVVAGGDKKKPPSLLDALKASGASEFAAFIESDPSTLELYCSGQVKTAFAPVDAAFARLRRDLTPAQQQLAQLQASSAESNLQTLRVPIPGSAVPTLDKSGNLGGQPQSVVTDSRTTAPTASNTTARRWTKEPLLKISSGLGKTVNLITSDIEFDGGLIHVLDGFFTLPETLSSTAKAAGLTTFGSLAASSNVSAKLDGTASITAFVPSNAAFAAASASKAGPGTANFLKGHVVADFVGYLPALKDGDCLTTQNGKTITISIDKDGNYFVEGAKITQANLITENGVVHVIDKVISPPPPVVVVAGAPANLPSLWVLAASIVAGLAIS